MAADGLFGDGIFSSTDPTRLGTWRNLGPAPLSLVPSDISCPTGSLCAATLRNFSGPPDEHARYLLTTRHPTGDAAKWKLAKGPRHLELDAISCRSESWCVALSRGGHAFSSRHPADRRRAWRHSTIDSARFQLKDISCASAGVCVAADDHGRVIVGKARR
jgi:hypothetical protein